MKKLIIYILALVVLNACNDNNTRQTGAGYDADSGNYVIHPEVGEQFSDNNYNDWDLGKKKC